jgi:hypothetical protein
MNTRTLLLIAAALALGVGVYALSSGGPSDTTGVGPKAAGSTPAGAGSTSAAAPSPAAPRSGVGSGPGLPDETAQSLEAAIEPALLSAEYADLKPEYLGARCAPPPCVVSLRFADAGPRSEAFRDHLYGHFVELGAPTGAQPSLVVEDPSAGRQRIWVYWVPPNLDAAVGEAMFQQVAAHVLDDRGPDLRAAPP